MGLTWRLICCQLIVKFHIQIISVFGNIEFKLIVMCNLYSVLICKSILKNCRLNLDYNVAGLDDRADFCIVCDALN